MNTVLNDMNNIDGGIPVKTLEYYLLRKQGAIDFDG
jgi:hypothetical protein